MSRGDILKLTHITQGSDIILDRGSCIDLRNNLGNFIVAHNSAVGDVSENSFLTVVGKTGSGSFVSNDETQIPIRCTTIDETCADFDDPVGLIKLDVEGKELAALKGSEKTIRRNRPIILAAVYHTWLQPDQIFSVKAYIESLNLGYEFQFKWLEPFENVIYEHWRIACCRDQFETDQSASESGSCWA